MTMQQPDTYKNTGVKRIFKALLYSVDGLKAAFRHEAAFRQEAFLALILIPLALYLEPGAMGRSLMIASVLLALIVELLNSAVEAIADRISLENHHLTKRAKDMGSAAVLIALINVSIIWLLVLTA